MEKSRKIFLKTENLDLVLLEKNDADLILEWFRDQEVNQFLDGGDFPLTTEYEEDFIAEVYKNPNELILGIWHKEDERLIGTVGLHHIHPIHLNGSLGISIGNKDYWGKGYGQETIKSILDWSFKIRGLRLVKLEVIDNNPRAKKCYENCGFTLVGTIPQSMFKQGNWYDKHIMIMRSPLV